MCKIYNIANQTQDSLTNFICLIYLMLCSEIYMCNGLESAINKVKNTELLYHSDKQYLYKC